MSKLPLLLLAVLCSALWGCSSAPIHYHTLLPVQAGGAVTARVRLERVEIPPQVDRSQLVVRQGDSGLVILENQWWGASLVDEFRSALEDQLGTPGTGAALLRVSVQRFDLLPGRYALLDARWSLQRAGGGPSLSCRSSLQTAANDSVEGLVAAQQANLRRFVQLVAQASANEAGGCPASN